MNNQNIKLNKKPEALNLQKEKNIQEDNIKHFDIVLEVDKQIYKKGYFEPSIIRRCRKIFNIDNSIDFNVINNLPKKYDSLKIAIRSLCVFPLVVIEVNPVIEKIKINFYYKD